MKKTETVVALDALFVLPPEQLFEQGALIPKSEAAIQKAKDTQVKNLKRDAKVVAALKRHYTAEQNAGRISGDMPFSSKKKDELGFFEMNCKGTLPGRVEALAALLNRLVLTNGADGKPLLDEKFFDSAKTDWLEKANAILSHAMDEHGDPAWKTCDDVVHVINALSGQPFNLGDTKGTLEEIRESQKEKAGTNAGDGTETAPKGETTPLTLGIALEFIKAAFAEAGAAPKDRQVELCAALFEINDAWANNDLTDSRREALDNQVIAAQEAGIAPTIKITHGEPVGA